MGEIAVEQKVRSFVICELVKGIFVLVRLKEEIEQPLLGQIPMLREAFTYSLVY